MYSGTNLALSSDVDQETHLYKKVKKKHTQENRKYKRAKRSALSQQVTSWLQGTDETA